MTKVILHGKLGKQFGREFNLHVASPADAIRAFTAMLPEFRKTFVEGQYYVYLGKGKDRTYLDEDNLTLHTNDVINIMPATVGAKKKGAGKLIAGIALVGIAFIPGLNAAVFGALGGVAGTSAGVSSGLAAAFSSVTTASQLAFVGGMSMILGGAAQLQAPKIKEQKESQLFGGTPDSVTEGTPVPLVYGEYLAMGYPVSFEIINGMNSYSGTGGSTGGGGIGGFVGGWDTVMMNAQ